MDLRRFTQKINCLTFIINSIEESNNRIRQFRIFKIRVICVHLRPIIKLYSFLLRLWSSIFPPFRFCSNNTTYNQRNDGAQNR